MNAMETNLLVQADGMSESSLVSLGDWELAYLRLAMVNRVEDAVNESLQDTCDSNRPRATSPHRKVGDQPCPPGQGCRGDDEVVLETKG